MYLYVPLVWELCPTVLLGVPTALILAEDPNVPSSNIQSREFDL